jgi:hypothetical protein
LLLAESVAKRRNIALASLREWGYFSRDVRSVGGSLGRRTMKRCGNGGLMLPRRPGWTCLFLFILLMVVATVTAQKSKPAPPPSPVYVWTAALPQEDAVAGVFGSGSYVSGSAVASGDIKVSVLYYAPTKSSPGRTEFVLRLTGVDSTVAGAPWIGFRGFVEASTSGTPACNFPGPSYAERDCILRFLAGAGTGPGQRHPQWPYSSVLLKLAVPGLRFDTMAEGMTTFLTGSIGVAVDGASEDVGLLSSVYSLSDVREGAVDVTRRGDSWQTRVELPLGAYELARFQRPNGTTGTTVPATTTTGPISTDITWTRTLMGGN